MNFLSSILWALGLIVYYATSNCGNVVEVGKNAQGTCATKNVILLKKHLLQKISRIMLPYQSQFKSLVSVKALFLLVIIG